MPNFIKKRKVVILLIIAISIVIITTVKIRSNGVIETVFPITGDLIRTVKISGKVTPTESVELGFETTGTVVSVAKGVGEVVSLGEIIVRIDSSGISSNILKAQANLVLAEANLEKLGGGGLYEAQIENAKRTVIQTVVDAYSAADTAVHNKTDGVFIDPNNISQLEIAFSFNENLDLRNSILKNRITIKETLNKWNSLIKSVGVLTYTENYLSDSKQYFAKISAYISDVTRMLNMVKASNSLSKSTLDGFRSDALLARDSLNNVSQNLISEEDSLKILLLEVPAQVARVEAARATLLNYKSQLSKTSLISPISGIISKQDAKIGQVVSPNTNLISIISEGFEIEAFVPEVLISGVRAGNPASVTLDAYGDKENFEAIITHIDPAETIRDGVSTYKIKLIFNHPDDRIKSGMTANINIETFRKNGVVLIPERTVVKEGDQTFIYIMLGDKKEKTPVITGEKDSSGNIELISELSSESKLVISPTTD